MSKKSTAPKTIPAATNGAARYDAFTVREYETAGEKRSDWTRLGVAFPHSDGKGFNLVLTALPVDGKITVRLHEPKPEGSAE